MFHVSPVAMARKRCENVATSTNMNTPWESEDQQKQKAETTTDEQSTSEHELEQQKQELLRHVSGYKTNTLRQRVAWILNTFPRARDSDMDLQFKYWELFESDRINGQSVSFENLRHLTRLTSLVRERARIQNQYKLFLASPTVRERRGTLSEEEKEKAINEKPSYPVFAVYMDESGKTSSHLLVGSVWFLAVGGDNITLFNNILALKKRSRFAGEFHFKDMKEDDFPVYKELIDMFLAHGNAVSFKLISLPRAGIKDTQAVLLDMVYHLLTKGIDHENSTGRAPLPRSLQLWKDAEEAGTDGLMLIKLEDKLRQASKILYGDQLALDHLSAVDSEDNVFLQVADLLASSANRILNRTGGKSTCKDKFADYLFKQLGFDSSLAPNSSLDDKMIYIAL